MPHDKFDDMNPNQISAVCRKVCEAVHAIVPAKTRFVVLMLDDSDADENAESMMIHKASNLPHDQQMRIICDVANGDDNPDDQIEYFSDRE